MILLKVSFKTKHTIIEMYNAMYTGRMAGAAGPPVELKFNCGFAWVAIRQLSVEKGIEDRDVSEKCLKELKVMEWRLNCLRDMAIVNLPLNATARN